MVPDPTTEGLSSSNSSGAAPVRTGLLPSGRMQVIAACAMVAFIATAFAYLQPLRPDPLEPATAWRWLIDPIERNGVFRPDDAAVPKPEIHDVFVAADGSAAWAVGQTKTGDAAQYIILKSADGGDSWGALARGPLADAAPAPAEPAVSASEPTKTGAELPATPIDLGLDPAANDPKLQAQNAAQQKTKSSQKGDGPAPVQQQVQQAQQQQFSSGQTIVDGTNTAGSTGYDKVDGLRAIWMSADGKRGWAVGGGGLILHTEDGSTWTREDSGTGADLATVSFGANGEQGWAAGPKVVVERNRDTWTARPSEAVNWLRVAATSDGHSAWIVSADCMIEAIVPGAAPQGKGIAVGSCSDIATFGDGKVALTATDDGLYERDLASGEDSRWDGSPGGLTAVAGSSDGNRVWVGDRTGRIFSSSARWGDLLTGPGRTERIAVSDSSDRIVALSGNTIVTSGDAGQSWTAPPYRRYPAPWLYLSWVALFGVGFMRVYSEERAARAAAEEAVAPEIEPDAPARKLADDRLAFKPVIEILTKFLRNTGTRPPLTIAIDGEWGSGKTSLMRMLQGELQQLGFPTVWFNPWHHQKEDVMLAALVQHIRTEGVPALLGLRGLGFRAQLTLRRVRRYPLATALIVMGLLTPLFFFLRHWPGDVFNYFESVINPAVDLIGALIPPQPESAQKIATSLTNPGLWFIVAFVIAAFFLVNALRSFPLSPAALLGTLNSKFSTQKAENQTDYRRRFGETFSMVTESLSPRPMVIFIDDLDRCLPEKALETLEATNYLSSSGQCFIVLGMARTRVERLIGLASERLAAEMAETEGNEYRIRKEADLQRELRRNYARRYLEKLVQLNVRVPSADGKRLLGLFAAEAGAASPDESNLGLRANRAWARGGFLAILCFAGFLAYWLGSFNWQIPSTATVEPAKEQSESAKSSGTVPPPPSSGNAPSSQPGPTAKPPAVAAAAAPAPASSGASTAYWPVVLLIIAVVLLFRRLGRTEDAPIKETPYYLRAITDWNGVVVSRQRSPRSVKLFGNLARYTAMMLLEPEARRKMSRPVPLFGKAGRKPKPQASESGIVQAFPQTPPRPSHERDCVAVALAAIYHVRPDILDGSTSILSLDWPRVLDQVRRSDEDRYRQRLGEIHALLETRATGQTAPAAVRPPAEDELTTTETQALADPELREDLLRLRSRRDAIEAIEEMLRELPQYYGAWPPSEEILQRFRLFVMGSVEAEPIEESPMPSAVSA